jgi:hypothetical protein
VKKCRGYDPEFDARVNDLWRMFGAMRQELGQRALDELLEEWADGRTPEELARMVRTRVFLGHGSVYPWYLAFQGVKA